MTFLSSLADDHRPLVLDTSVLVNLHASGHGEQVLSVIENDIVIADAVALELEHETSRRNGEQGFLRGLTGCGKITVVDLTTAEYELFAALSGGPSSLDDGEAATIAIAVHRGFRPVVDERKGRARAAALMNGEQPAWSIDLLRHPQIVHSLGEQLASEAIYLALRHGRMRIPSDSADYIVTLIGHNRAFECTCLPNFKSLSQEAPSLEPTDAKTNRRERPSDTN